MVRWVVAAGVAVEACVLAAGAVYLVVGVLTAPADDVGAAVALVLMAVCAAAFLGAAARGVAQGAAWVRGPVVAWQLLQAGSVLTALRATPVVAVPALVLAVVVTVGLFVPGVVAARAPRPGTGVGPH